MLEIQKRLFYCFAVAILTALALASPVVATGEAPNVDDFQEFMSFDDAFDRTNWSRVYGAHVNPGIFNGKLVIDFPGGSTVMRYYRVARTEGYDYKDSTYVEIRTSVLRDGRTLAGAVTSARFGFGYQLPPYSDFRPSRNGFNCEVRPGGVYWRQYQNGVSVYSNASEASIRDFEGVFHAYTMRIYPDTGDVWTRIDDRPWLHHEGVYPVGSSVYPYLEAHHNHGNHGTVTFNKFYIDDDPLYEPGEPGVGEPCTINVYDADSRLPLSGFWDYYIVIQGADSISGSASGASKVVNLPATSILQPHRIRVTKEGYVQVPEHLAFNVPAGGREIPVYLRSTTAAPEEGNVWLGFTCTDADTGSPVPGALVNLDGSAQYTSASGYVRFQVPMNSSHKWVASSSSHWPMGGDITVGTVDLNVPVELVRKTSDLPRPPLPELPNFPVIHPSLDPAGFRMKILDVPVLGGLASPLLDTMDALAAGLDDIAQPVLDFATAPADKVVEVLEGVGDQLTEPRNTPAISV